MLCNLTIAQRLIMSDTLFPVYNDRAETSLEVLRILLESIIRLLNSRVDHQRWYLLFDCRIQSIL